MQSGASGSPIPRVVRADHRLQLRLLVALLRHRLLRHRLSTVRHLLRVGVDTGPVGPRPLYGKPLLMLQ